MPGRHRPQSFQLSLRSTGQLKVILQFSSVHFIHSVVSDSLQPHELQHARPPYPSPTPGVYPNPCPSSQLCHPTISPSVVPFSSCHQSFPASGSFQNESVLHIRWPKDWSFSFNISPSNEHPRLISFSIYWLNLLAVQGTLKLLQLLFTLLCCTKSPQSCLTLCNPMDYSPQVSSVHGILQARVLEWVAISFSRRSSQPRD